MKMGTFSFKEDGYLLFWIQGKLVQLMDNGEDR
jgi:hypothetical protein